MIGDYTRINFNNGATPAINSTNLNKMDSKLDELDAATTIVTSPGEITVSNIVTSGAMISNLNADKLDGQHAAYFQKAITISDNAPTPSDGVNGDIWIEY